MKNSRSKLPEKALTTGIGSLPHHNIDAALAFSFSLDVPFLPQIPIRNPWEYMIAQALEGMPGLNIERDGAVLLNIDVWTGRQKAFQQKLDEAFRRSEDPEAFSAFEPSNAASSSWQPYLWELEEQKKTWAKIQLAGPITSQWVLRLQDGSNCEKYPEIGEQIFRLVLARSLAMCRRLIQSKIAPIFYWDEPGLFALQKDNPKHVVAIQQLKVTTQALQQEGVWVGLHCCSETNWETVFGTGIDILSIDTDLSLPSLMKASKAFNAFLVRGGRMSFGIIPTDAAHPIEEIKVETLMSRLRASLKSILDEKHVNEILSSSIYTPACGLALNNASDAEQILQLLQTVHRFL